VNERENRWGKIDIGGEKEGVEIGRGMRKEEMTRRGERL
jgi:hypothetical protein